MISVQITNIESKMLQPPSGFISEGAASENCYFPVIQICGSSSSVQGYQRPSNMDDFIFKELQTIESHLPGMQQRIDEELERLKNSDSSPSHKRKRKFVQRLEVVSKRSLYGYFPGNVFFVKVYLRNTFDSQKVFQLLADGLFGSVQCFEAHVPPVLQFLLDYNLFGMDWIDFSDATFRASEEDLTPTAICNQALALQPAHALDGLTLRDLVQSQTTEVYRQQGLLDSLPIEPSPDSRHSTCELEFDVHAAHIVIPGTIPLLADPLVSSASTSSTKASLPATISHMVSLVALWREEEQRRLRADIPQDEFSTPPYTDTCHRNLEIVERQFLQRFEILIEKGKQLYVVNHAETSIDSFGHNKIGAEPRSHLSPLTEIFSDDSDNGFLSQWAMQKVAQEKAARNDEKTCFEASQIFSFQDIIPDKWAVETSVCVNDNFASDEEIEEADELLFEEANVGRFALSRERRSQLEVLRTQRELDAIISCSQAEFDNSEPPARVSHMSSEPVDLGIASSSSRARRIVSAKKRSISEAFDPLSSSSKANEASSSRRGHIYTDPIHAAEINSPCTPLHTISDRFKSSLDNSTKVLSSDLKINDSMNMSYFHFSPDSASPLLPSQPSNFALQYIELMSNMANTIDSCSYLAVCLAPSYLPPTFSSVKNWIIEIEFSKEPDAFRRKSGSKVLPSPASTYIICDVSRCLVPTYKPPASSIFSSTSKLDIAAAAKPIGRIGGVVVSSSQILSPTQTQQSNSTSQNCMKNSQAMSSSSNSKPSRVKILSIEIFCKSRLDLKPDPKFDEVCFITWISQIQTSDSESENNENSCGIIIQKSANISQLNKTSLNISMQTANLPENIEIEICNTEVEVFDELTRLVALKLDPDFLFGYEVQHSSIGYLVARGKILGLNLLQLLSRFPLNQESSRNEYDKYGQEHHSGIWISGRSVLNIWRVMKDELKMSCNTLNHSVQEVLGRKFPCFSNRQLTRWYGNTRTMSRTLKHIFQRTDANIQLLEKLDIIRRTSEYARLYGIDFFSVLSRGSQYRVEASMLRIAHSLGYLAASATKSQVSRQAAMEVIPLVMEPFSGYYEDPVIVLDFQSLYPSMIIAYNLCFSTCCGKIRGGVKINEFDADTTERIGFIPYPEQASAQAVYNEKIKTSSGAYVSPNGAMFCSKQTREGILPLMLKELLATRQMIKRSTKLWLKEGKSSVLPRVLEARQLALKLLANVTYGYTAAGYSGRMPMAELADAVVQCGRSTLEWTAKLINENSDWKGQVIYGDTDSVFVLLKGRSRTEAFQIGEDIAKKVTSMSPESVVLKLEKVYGGLFLLAKKRYVGMAYTSSEQLESNFDAKGIEVVRRDQCPATQKIQEKALRIMFKSNSLEDVKRYLCEQWSKLHIGFGPQLPLKDFIFRKAVKLGHYSSSSEGALPPGALLTKRKILSDPMAEVPFGWRVPYVVIWGYPKAPLKDLIVSPEDLLIRGGEKRINHTYYITKCINPSLDRIFRLCGADISSWYYSSNRPNPRIRRFPYKSYSLLPSSSHPSFKVNGGNKRIQSTITAFANTCICIACGLDSSTYVCFRCIDSDAKSALSHVLVLLKETAKKEHEMSMICHNCSKIPQLSTIGESIFGTGPDNCSSLDCHIFFERIKLVLRLEDLNLAEIDALKLLNDRAYAANEDNW